MAEVKIDPQYVRGLESSLFIGLNEDQKRAVAQWRRDGIPEEEITRRVVVWRT